VPTNPDPLPQHNKQSSPLVVELVRQSRFQMDDDGDLHEQILHIEAHIEELTDIIERCRKIILFSKVAVAAGGILILATIIGAVGFDPTVGRGGGGRIPRHASCPERSQYRSVRDRMPVLSG
jgi:hypothetical protein